MSTATALNATQMTDDQISAKVREQGQFAASRGMDRAASSYDGKYLQWWLDGYDSVQLHKAFAPGEPLGRL